MDRLATKRRMIDPLDGQNGAQGRSGWAGSRALLRSAVDARLMRALVLVFLAQPPRHSPELAVAPFAGRVSHAATRGGPDYRAEATGSSTEPLPGSVK
jgi:hypothetical protein